MKVTDVLSQMNGDVMIQKILDRYKSFPAGSISPREVIKGLDFKVQSREEAEELMAELDATVSSAILDFQDKRKRSK